MQLHCERKVKVAVESLKRPTGEEMEVQASVFNIYASVVTPMRNIEDLKYPKSYLDNSHEEKF